MFLLLVVGLMFILPIASLVVDLVRARGGADILLLAGKWFAFWAVGARLFLAGTRQALNPAFTAREIFGISATDPLVVIRELGFANIAIGTIGLASLAVPTWTPPAAVAGGLFIGSAGVAHMFRTDRNRLENVVMVSNLFVLGVLVAYSIRLWRS